MVEEKVIQMQKTSHISLSEAKQRLGELVKRSSYGGERFILEFRGKPCAVLAGYEAVETDDPEARKARALKALEELRVLREKTRSSTGVQFNSVEEIRKMREERDNQILGLR